MEKLEKIKEYAYSETYYFPPFQDVDSKVIVMNFGHKGSPSDIFNYCKNTYLPYLNRFRRERSDEQVIEKAFFPYHDYLMREILRYFLETEESDVNFISDFGYETALSVKLYETALNNKKNNICKNS